MKNHLHTWRCTVNLLLSLPDPDGWADRLVCFACRDCPEEALTTGWYHRTSRLVWPDEAQTVQGQGADRALGRLAAQQQRHRVAGLRRRRHA